MKSYFPVKVLQIINPSGRVFIEAAEHSIIPDELLSEDCNVKHILQQRLNEKAITH